MPLTQRQQAWLRRRFLYRGRYRRAQITPDTMIFIYLFEHHPRYHDAAYEFFALVGQGALTATTSVLSRLECLTGVKKQKRHDLVSRYRLVFTAAPNLTTVNLDGEIAEVASDLRAKYAIRTPDAIQVATAIYTGSDAFLTNDGNLKRVQEIEVLLLDDLIEALEGQRRK